MYRDRTEAGEILAACLQQYRGTGAVVLALPRGGVAVAAPVAQRLGLPLGVMLVRKVGCPGHAELAVAAVAGANGEDMAVNAEVARHAGLTHAEIDRLAKPERTELRRRRRVYAAPEPAIAGHDVLLVDDGLATGATARAAVQALRRQAPARIILAVPVASAEAAADLRHQVDALVCPLVPRDFIAVGAHYRDFPQLTDAEVTALLHPAPPPAGPSPDSAPRQG